MPLSRVRQGLSGGYPRFLASLPESGNLRSKRGMCVFIYTVHWTNELVALALLSCVCSARACIFHAVLVASIVARWEGVRAGGFTRILHHRCFSCCSFGCVLLFHQVLHDVCACSLRCCQDVARQKATRFFAAVFGIHVLLTCCLRLFCRSHLSGKAYPAHIQVSRISP